MGSQVGTTQQKADGLGVPAPALLRGVALGGEALSDGPQSKALMAELLGASARIDASIGGALQGRGAEALPLGLELEILCRLPPLSEDAERLHRRLYLLKNLARMTLAERPDAAAELLADLAPEQRLAGMAPEQRLAGMAPEQRLAGLTREQMLLALPDDLLRLQPDEVLASLSPEARAAVHKRVGR